jgi:hypothetical protein
MMIHLADENQKQKRLEMIRQAFKEKAPVKYSEVEASGKLQDFLEEHDAEMMVYYNDAIKEVWENTLERFLGFSDLGVDETTLPTG